MHDLLPPLIKNLEAEPVLHLFKLLKSLPIKEHTEHTIYLAQVCVITLVLKSLPIKEHTEHTIYLAQVCVITLVLKRWRLSQSSTSSSCARASPSRSTPSTSLRCVCVKIRAGDPDPHRSAWIRIHFPFWIRIQGGIF